MRSRVCAENNRKSEDKSAVHFPKMKFVRRGRPLLFSAIELSALIISLIKDHYEVGFSGYVCVGCVCVCVCNLRDVGW